MWHATPILSNSGDGLGYIIAVALLMVVGWGVERVKTLMSGSQPPQPPAQRPPRSASPPLPRPQIPPTRESGASPRPRPAPPVARPRPPAWPPAERRPAPPAMRGIPLPDRPPARPVPAAVPARPVEPVRRMGDPMRDMPVPMLPGTTSIPTVGTSITTDDSRARLAGEWAQDRMKPLAESKAPPTSPAGRPRATAKARPGEKRQPPMLQGLTAVELRRALILKEIIDPPLALRQE